MEKNLTFFRKLPIPKEVKAQYPISPELTRIRQEHLLEMQSIFEGKSDKLLLIVGPCSADAEKPVLEYAEKLGKLQGRVKDKLMLVPRVYTNKPRSTGEGYKGMLHQPDPNAAPDLLRGIVATRRLHLKVFEESGLVTADEMLYPENHRYMSDILGYVAVGARSSENQQHRLVSSGIDTPVGMKNSTGGNISILLNSIKAAQSSHTFLYRGWEVESRGNPLAHAILRGYVDKQGVSHSNYGYDDLCELSEAYLSSGLKNPSVIIDTNHANSGKNYLEQPAIALDVLKSARRSSEIRALLKGFMIESYLEDGSQEISDCEIYGKSITDPCLGWSKTEKLILEIADIIQ